MNILKAKELYSEDMIHQSGKYALLILISLSVFVLHILSQRFAKKIIVLKTKIHGNVTEISALKIKVVRDVNVSQILTIIIVSVK